MNWLKMREKAAGLLAQARDLQNTLDAEIEQLAADAVEERSSEIEALVTEARDLQKKAARLEATATQIQAADDDQEEAMAPRTSLADGAPPRTRPNQSRGAGSIGSMPAEPRDTEAEARGGFRDFADFAHAVYRSNPAAGAHYRPDRRLHGLEGGDDSPRMGAAATGLSQGVGSEGGFLVPPAFATSVWNGMLQQVDSLLGRTDQFPIDGESITLLANAETSRASGSRYGGIQGYWIGEAEQITASKPKVRKMRLEPHELACLVYVTDKLLNNGGAAVSNWLQRAAVDELSWLIGEAIVNGTGSGQPLGILNSGGLVTVAKESGQANDTLVQANIAKMWARCPARMRRSAVWLMNQDCDPQLDLMVTEVKNVAGSENVGGFQASLYNRENDTLYGRPIIRTEYNPTLGDAGDIILADLGSYATAFHRSGVSQAMSMHLRFDYAETAFRFMANLDGHPWVEKPLTPAKGTATLSPFVTLAAR